MAWQHRSHRVVPSDWGTRKKRVLMRDGRTCHDCGHGGADEVDHLVNVAAGGSHEYDNLAAIHGAPCPTCGRECHKIKTQAEAAAARAKQRASARHPRERHPGLA